MNWGDMEDDVGVILPPTSTTSKPNPNGDGIIKTTVSYHMDGDKRMKTTKRVRCYTKVTRVAKRCAERRQTWKKFGDAADTPPGPEQGITTVSFEEVYLDRPECKKEDEQQKTLDSLLNWARGRRWRFNDDEGEDGGTMTAGVDGEMKKPGGYIPPHMRGTGRAPMSMRDSGGGFRDEGHTIRVTNISEDTKEADLQELFRPFGRVTRIYLAKDRVTMQSRGFAFVTFLDKSDAQRAMDKLDGYGYDHLILKLEWAKPSVRDSSGGGLSGGYTSGYGKALPQGLGK